MVEYAPQNESRTGPVVRNPGLEPVRVEGCTTCAALSEPREVVREAGITEAVATTDQEISNHPHSTSGNGWKLPVSSVWGVAV